MRRWALITVGLYLALFVLLTLPVVLVFGGEMLPAPWELYTMWEYWLPAGVLVLCQALLLLVPVRAVEDLRIKRRHISAPLLTAGFLAAVLTMAFVACILAAILGDSEAWEVLQWVLLGLVAAGWVFWALRFRKYAKTSGEPRQWLDKITLLLIKGSIVELLVAVACHIVVRRRGDCSAPAATFFGIAAGIAVMLLAFGPGVFYLFAKRARQMMSRKKREESEAV